MDEPQVDPLIKDLRAYAQEHGIADQLKGSATGLGWGTLDTIRCTDEPWRKGLNLLSLENRHGPIEHFFLSTKDRFLWHEHREALARIVWEHDWQMSEDWVWRWDEQEGEHWCRDMPRMFILSGKQTRPWHPRPVCLSRDPRSFRSVFELLREQKHVTDGGYRWTETGFVFTSFHKVNITAVQKVFSDCEMSVETQISEHGLGRFWEITVVFPDMVERADA